MGDIDIRGLEDLARLSRALRAAGDQGKGLKRELSSGINRETKQTRKEMRAAILPALPKSGGLAADVQRSTRFTTTVRTGGGSAGVSIKARGKRSIRRMNTSGTVRHRVFGRGPWVTQTAGIEKGFLDKPFEESRPRLQRAVVRAVAATASKIYRSV
jgi:hypothetical protein